MKKKLIPFILLIVLSVVICPALPRASAEEPAVYHLIPYMERSDAVFEVQAALLKLGYFEDGDNFAWGYFDETTLKALRLFCADNHFDLPPEGISPDIQKFLLESSPAPRVTPAPAAILPVMAPDNDSTPFPMIYFGTSGEAVREAQQRLKDLDYFRDQGDPEWGVYEVMTQRAVERFCELNGIPANEYGMGSVFLDRINSDDAVRNPLPSAPLRRGVSGETVDTAPGENTLVWFYFMRGGYMAPHSYEVTLTGNGYAIMENEGKPWPLDPSLAEELLRVVEDHGMKRWDAFHGSNPHVLDGESFSLTMEFADGTRVYASGDNSFPDGYQEASSQLDEIFEKAVMSRVAGVYRYEGEGFGGDFTLTLNADGSYTFYEGVLSSYMGGGTWRIYLNAVDLEEENGFDLSFTFGVEDGALVYLSEWSDPFPYVKVSDMERFVRVQGTKENMKRE